MNTSSIDYRINMDNIEKVETIVMYQKVEVYIAKWRTYQKVCVKKIFNEKEVDNELAVLSKCIHPKIVQCFGASKDDDFTYILFDYMENGNLEDYLHKVKLDHVKKIDLMMDITIGLHYLHNRKPEIILHRDLKPANILINKYGEAKISDFGISKLVTTETSDLFTGHTGEKGTYTWMSPEVLKHEEYNYKSDIYSLGLIMYYIWTEKKPFHEEEMNTIQMMFAKFQNKLTIEIKDNEDMDDLINWCCSFEKENRPSSQEVIEELIQIKKNHSI